MMIWKVIKNSFIIGSGFAIGFSLGVIGGGYILVKGIAFAMDANY